MPHPIIELIALETQFIGERSGFTPNIEKLLGLISKSEISEAALPSKVPSPPLNQSYMQTALELVDDAVFPRLSSAINEAYPFMWWKAFVNDYYTKGSDLGSHFLMNNMFCDIIGPLSDAFYRDDVRMGVFIMPPRSHYRDHVHAGAELYINTTGKSGWRFDKKDWQDLEANTCIWNDPWRIHAMRTYDNPLLMLYGWFGDVGRLCETRECESWVSMENQLQAGNIMDRQASLEVAL